MKEYFDRNQEKDYITGYKISKDKKEITVEFSEYDSKKTRRFKYKNIEANIDNINKLNKIMDEQMSKAINNKEKFIKNKKNAFLVGTISTLGGIAYTGVLASSFPDTGFVIGTGIGVVVAFGATLKNYVSQKAKVDEIEKAEKIIKYRDKLENIEQFPNALVKTSGKFSKLLKNPEPFSINNIENIRKKDLENVIDNIDREERLGFQYVKTSK